MIGFRPSQRNHHNRCGEVRTFRAYGNRSAFSRLSETAPKGRRALISDSQRR